MPALSQVLIDERPDTYRRGAIGRWALLVAAGLLIALLPFGCTTLSLRSPTGLPASAASPTELRLGLLSVGMSIDDVARIEPEPEKIVTMESQTMTVVKWIYGSGRNAIALYFTNGLLESW